MNTRQTLETPEGVEREPKGKDIVFDLPEAFWVRLRAEFIAAQGIAMAAMREGEGQFISQKRAANILGKTPGTIRAMQKDGRLGRYGSGMVKRSELYAQVSVIEGTSAEEKKADELLRKRR